MQITIKGILSFPHLFTPRAIEQGQEPKYSCSVLIPKNDPQVAQIQQAIDTEKQNGFPSGFPANGKLCLVDCALPKSNGEPNDPKLANYYELRATSGADQKPHVVDMNTQPVMDPGKVFAGAVAWVAINTYSYNKPTSKGVTAGLNGVMLTGEEGALGRLDNKPSAEQLFAGIAGGAAPVQQAAPAPVSAAPAPQAPPAAPSAPPAAPAAPQFPPEGWQPHPDAAGYFYCGQEVLTEQALRAKYNIVQPSFA